MEPLPSAVRQPPRPPGPPAPPTTGFAPRPGRGPRPRREPVGFVLQVIAELRATAWPSSADTMWVSWVVLVVLAAMTAVVFAVDAAGARLELFLLP